MHADHGNDDDQGFRIRGAQPTRLDAFVDAAFAFAVTLLVIAIGHVPASVQELQQAMRGVPAFAASFFVIARFWKAHRDWSRRYGIEDGFSVRLSLLLVFVTLVYVYPLRMVAAMVLGMVSGGFLSEQRLDFGSIDELRALYVTFAIGYAVTVTTLALLHWHALRLADTLALSPRERAMTRTATLRYTLFLGVALLSLLLALTLPMSNAQPIYYSVPGMAYALIYAIRLLLVRRERAELATIRPATP
ncbi:MAG TPA: TMEM175 family protein [Dokdonella sp.]